jgi:hypothetical protein
VASRQPRRFAPCCVIPAEAGNADNWRARHDGTDGAILEQVHGLTGGAPEAFVAGVRTGGTLTGVGRRRRAANPRVHIAAVIPEISPSMERLKPLGQPGDIVPAILDESLIAELLPVSLEDAVAMCRELARQGLSWGRPRARLCTGRWLSVGLADDRDGAVGYRRALHLDGDVAEDGVSARQRDKCTAAPATRRDKQHTDTKWAPSSGEPMYLVANASTVAEVGCEIGMKGAVACAPHRFGGRVRRGVRMHMLPAG